MNNTTICITGSNVTCIGNTNGNSLIQIGDPQEIIRTFLTIPLALIGSLGSCGSLWSIWHYSFHQKTTANLMFVNMSIATLLLCAIHISLAIYMILTPFEYDFFRFPQYNALCQFESFFYWVCLYACSNSHVVTALDRVDSVYRLGHRGKFPWFLIALSWVLPVIISVFPLFHLGGVYGFADAARRCVFVKMDSKAYRIAYRMASGIVPIVLMVPSYMAVYYKVYVSKRRVQQYPVQANLGRGRIDTNTRRAQDYRHRVRQMRAEVQMSKIAGITCLIFILCFLPASIFGVAAPTLAHLQSSTSKWLQLLQWFGCAISPVVYLLLNSTLRNHAGKQCSSLLGCDKKPRKTLTCSSLRSPAGPNLFVEQTSPQSSQGRLLRSTSRY